LEKSGNIVSKNESPFQCGDVDIKFMICAKFWVYPPCGDDRMGMGTMCMGMGITVYGYGYNFFTWGV